MSEPTPFNWDAFWTMDGDASPLAAREPDKHLLAHYQLWLRGRRDQRVLVPLCGRSYDMLWLYQQGHSVTGCELVERPVRRFFADHRLPHAVTAWPGGLRFASLDGRLTVFQGDVLQLTPELAGAQHAVWDVAALQDIAPADRPRYGRLMRRLLADDFRYLVYCTQHENAAYAGPPHSVTSDVIEATFGDFCRVRQLFAPEKDTEFDEPEGADAAGEDGGESGHKAPTDVEDPTLREAKQMMMETIFFKCMYLLTPK